MCNRDTGQLCMVLLIDSHPDGVFLLFRREGGYIDYLSFQIAVIISQQVFEVQYDLLSYKNLSYMLHPNG